MKAWLFGFRSVRRTMPKVLAKLERVGSGHDSQINKQLLLVEHVATSSRSSLSLSHSPPLALELFTVAIKISAQRRRVKLFNFIKTKRQRALELRQRAEVTPWQRQQTEIPPKKREGDNRRERERCRSGTS